MSSKQGWAPADGTLIYFSRTIVNSNFSLKLSGGLLDPHMIFLGMQIRTYEQSRSGCLHKHGRSLTVMKAVIFNCMFNNKQ